MGPCPVPKMVRTSTLDRTLVASDVASVTRRLTALYATREDDRVRIEVVHWTRGSQIDLEKGAARDGNQAVDHPRFAKSRRW